MELSKTELAVQYVEKYIEISKRTGSSFSKRNVANILHTDYPDLFSSTEDARLFVRHVTNSMGKTIDKYEELARRISALDDPIEELKNAEPYILPIANNRILYINDVHGQFYDKKAFEIALNDGLKNNCNTVLINGDFIDFYGESRFDKSPSVTRFINEREWAIDVLSLLQDTFGKVYYKQGNHDKRFMDYVNQKFGGNQQFMDYIGTLKDFVFFDGSTVEVIEDYRVVKLGKLNAIHGHEYFGGGGINVARNRFLKTFQNTISGHSHISRSFPFTNIDGEYMGSWAVGCLAKLNPRYNPKNGWNHGFAVIETESNGEFEVNNKIIINSKARHI